VENGGDARGLPRMLARAGSNQGGMLNEIVVEPPTNGRRNLAGGKAERRRTRINGVGALRGSIGKSGEL
jgi:hypothetical protein